MTTRLVVAVMLSLGVAVGAWQLHILTVSGAAAATVVGTLVLGFGGWPMAVVLIVGFATSGVLTRWHAERKSHPEHRNGRAGAQVIANGAIAAGLASWSGIASAPWAIPAFAGAVAALTADTWATELGLLSLRPPRLITTGRVVERGRSGGVTWIGTLAATAGAALISGVATWLLHTSFVSIWLAGMLAMIVDSLLGATVEGRYRSIDNNVVNFLMTGVGAAVAIVLTSR